MRIQTPFQPTPHLPRLSRPGALLLAVALCTLLAPVAVAAADPACQPLSEASRRQLRTPTHLYATETAAYTGGKERHTETIQTGDAIYVRSDGRWQRSPIRLQGLRDLQDEKARDGKGTCRYLRDEAVSGEAAAVYNVRSDSADARIDSTVWISRRTGLPLRSELDIDLGGTAGKRHTSLRYDYANVQPPPV